MQAKDFLIVLAVVALTSGLLLGDKVIIDYSVPLPDLQIDSVEKPTEFVEDSSESQKLSSILSYHVRLQSALARHVRTSKCIVAARNFETVGDWVHAHEQYTSAVFAIQSDRTSGIKTSLDTALTGHLYAYIAKTLQMRGLNEQALTHLNAAIKMDEFERSFYDQRAKIYRTLGRLQNADDDVRKAKSMEWNADSPQ